MRHPEKVRQTEKDKIVNEKKNETDRDCKID